MNGRPGQRAAGYEARQVEAARRVIVELWQILGPYREAMVLVGGWVPDLLLPRATPPHTGSIDVDLLLNPEPLREGQYAELLRAIETRGYRRTKPFRFAKDVVVDGGDPVTVEVDFLVPKGSLRRPHSEVGHGFRAIAVEGALLAIESTQSTSLDGSMPDGARNRVEIQVASVEGFLVMKAFALRGRLKEKDAYDIVFCLQNWPGGATAVADRLRPFAGRAEVREAMRILAVHFASPDHLGARSVAAFLDPAGPDERAFVARDAYERVQALLREVGFEVE